jgi:hypothetical protein
MLTTRTLALGLLTLAAAGFAPTTAIAADDRGGFVVHNDTGVTIRYQVKWGEKGDWKSQTLESGYQLTHSIALKNGKAPRPYVRFDNYGGDGKVSTTEYHVNFGPQVYIANGHGTTAVTDRMWHYEFQYGGNGRSLNLFKK